MFENRVNAKVAPADKSAVMAEIESIKSKLPAPVDLSAEERQSLPKLGAKSERFVRAAASMVATESSFLPRSFDEAAFQADVALYNDLYDIWQQLERLTQQVSDTLVVAGNEAYTGALVVYKAAKDYGRGAELDNFVDEMGKRFWRKSSPEPKPPVEG